MVRLTICIDHFHIRLAQIEDTKAAGLQAVIRPVFKAMLCLNSLFTDIW